MPRFSTNGVHLGQPLDSGILPQYYILCLRQAQSKSSIPDSTDPTKMKVLQTLILSTSLKSDLSYRFYSDRTFKRWILQLHSSPTTRIYLQPSRVCDFALSVCRSFIQAQLAWNL